MINITHEDFGESSFQFVSVRHWLPRSNATASSVWPDQASHSKIRLARTFDTAFDTTLPRTGTDIVFAASPALHEPHRFFLPGRNTTNNNTELRKSQHKYAGHALAHRNVNNTTDWTFSFFLRQSNTIEGSIN